MVQLTKQASQSYKIGVDEVVGLKKAMATALMPVIKSIKDRAYWNDSILDWAEYKSRDGFIPHSHNCGGLEICLHVPDCEKYDFSFLEFGEWDGEHMDGCTNHEICDCHGSQDGEYDAYMRIWFKFEGIQDDGTMSFYLCMSGGNQDAPYFREKYLPTLFEASFSCKSVAGLKRAASKHVNALLKAVQS